MTEELCGATTTIGVDSYDSPAYRKCVLPTHPVTECHEDQEGLPWVDEEYAKTPPGAEMKAEEKARLDAKPPRGASE